MSCSADSRPAAQFQWLFNGELLSFTGAQLELMKIQMNQSGDYSCQAFNSKTHRYTTSEPGLISVLKRIMNISVESSSNQPMEGSSVNIICDASGSIFSRKWLINGQELKPSENIVFYEQKQVLSFNVLNRKDSGTYVCEISNSINSETASYSLHVNYGPENVQISGPKEIQEGKTLKLRCFCDSVPTANYTWIKNRKILAQSSEYTKESAGSSDSGQYICKATNKITKKTVEASHTVLVTERVSDARVTVSSSDSVEFISSVTLSCSASGLSLSFLWLNGSDEVTASDRVNLTDGGATLTIATVRRSDQGPFRCKVSNPVSSSTSDPAELSISYGPDDVILKTSPQIDDFEEGSDVLMSCSADSRPAAQFQWLFNGELLSFTGAQLELMKIQMNQSGDYSCQAFNSKTHRYTTSEPGLISVLNGPENVQISGPKEIQEGKTLKLRCFCDSVPTANYTWIKNRKILAQSSEYTKESAGSSDSGQYICKATNKITKKTVEASHTVLVTERVSDARVTVSSSDSVEFISSVTLSCSASGLSLSFLWLNGSDEVTASDRVNLTDGGATLTIATVRRSDQGPFRCKVSNPVSSSTSDPAELSISCE
ncbi:cell adhesion molecule CEACAM5-like isoform X3 [Eucyclogobius newberryi]|uniref:cell adhesion molecule CEACAM5-like isoform X3 n=1 Tax=Eucyclogobius newberryi TaxID=166745 RepID=UPI003B5B6218